MKPTDINEGEISIDGTPFTARIAVERDDCAGAPWEECEGHGVVSEWTTRDKRAGERVICTDRHSKRYYDIAESMKIAKRDGWNAEPYTGTKGERAARAVERDFEFCKGWLNDDWFYAVVTVVLLDEDGKEIASESMSRVETLNDYWQEAACEILNPLIEDAMAQVEHKELLAN